jgi:hypothetical protein
MAQPTYTDVHVDAALTNISVAYVQDAKNFIAAQVFPTLPVDHRSDKYFIYDKQAFRRSSSKKRAPGTESAGGGFPLTTGSYAADIHAFHKDIDDPTRQNADAALNIERDATVFVTQQLLIEREVDWATKYMATSVWGTDKVGGTDFTVWSDGSSDPEKDIDDGKNLILKSTGYLPNTFVVSYGVHQALKRHPLVQERYKYTSPNSITEDMLARFLEVERYLVAKASYDTSAEGAAASNAFIIGDSALLVYSAPAPSLMQPSGGYTFAWSGFTGMNSNGLRIKNFRMEHLESDRIEGQFAYDQKLVAADMGYFFSAAI